MKATGIVRRIDDLGRVVIPKEIRRTMRIREGDPLEIYTDKDGEVIFKKYSPVGEISTSAIAFAEALAKNSSMSVVITDTDSIIAASGSLKKDLIDKNISTELVEIIQSRSTYIYKTGKGEKIFISNSEPKKYASIIIPIIVNSDTIGCIATILPDSGAVSSEIDVKLTTLTAQLLSKQIEE